MAWTQTDLDQLRAAIAKGVRTVQYDNKRVTYQTTAEMLRVLAAMEQDVNGTRGRVFQQIVGKKGL